MKKKKGLVRETWSRYTVAAVVLLVFLTVLSACSGSSDNSEARAESAPMAGEAEQNAAPAAGDNFKSDSLLSKSNQVAKESQAGGSADLSAEPLTEQGTSVDSSSSLGIGQVADSQSGFGRKVIYNANLVMKVEKFQKAEEQLRDLIHQSSAYLLKFTDSRSADEVGATYVIKVPSTGFSPFLERLQKIKNVKFERQVDGSDVTEEYVDLEARLKAKTAVEARLLAFMDKATKSDDLVRFSNELGGVQQEIEQIKGRMRYLNENVAFSTVNLRLYEGPAEEAAKIVEEKDRSFGQRISDALAGSANVLGRFGEGLLIVIAAILPVVIVAAVVGVPAYLIVRKRRLTRISRSAENRSQWNQAIVNPPESQSDDRDSTSEAVRQEPEEGNR
ncbi:DUF4349 domain-containing protein [Cohnella faecalis]|uniref:DUF4349 domain-containing protein n=1 Tax=Cohnella faecalis TaxID=2315694 RepID=A0A398CYE0_9BACL|nr:DUF4349 domain-containing protein [Cohnella faecalis]RIE04251.1 DUF4349 domain-containing protein [Cohnella faecalis]